MKLIEIIGDLVKQLHHCWSCIRTAKQVTLYMQLQNKYVGHNERCLFCLQKTCKACNWARLLVTSGRSWDGSWVEIEWIAEAIVTLNLKPASHVWSEVSSYCISILFHPNVRFDIVQLFSQEVLSSEPFQLVVPDDAGKSHFDARHMPFHQKLKASLGPRDIASKRKSQAAASPQSQHP